MACIWIGIGKYEDGWVVNFVNDQKAATGMLDITYMTYIVDIYA